MISFDEALPLVLTLARRLPSESVPLLKSLGRVLREDIKAKHPIPPFDRSAMDGYAVRAADTESASPARPVELSVIEDIPAGRHAPKPLGPGQAARIMTGAPLPVGADAVVMVEHTQKKDRTVQVLEPVAAGDNLALAGEDVRPGQVVLSAGTVLGPAEMGMLAAVGKTRVKVSRRPRVAVISTGDELVAPGKKLLPGRIRDANGYSLTGMALAAGAEAKFLGIARDTPEQLRGRLKRARGFDVVVLSGGVSVGDYDQVRNILHGEGVKQVLWKVTIKPGKPLFVGRCGRQIVFGLPGNPVSCLVTFCLFILPLLDAMQGKRRLGLVRGRARLAGDIKIKPGRRHFLRGVLTAEGLEPWVTVLRDQHSGVLRSMVEANVMVDVPGEVTGLSAGTEVDIWHLP